MTAMPKRADANLDGEHRPILSAMRSLEGGDLPGIESRVDPLNERCVHAGVEAGWRHPNQFLTSVAKALAGLTVQLNDPSLLVLHEQGIGRVVHVSPEAGLGGAQLFLGPFGSVTSAAVPTYAMTSSASS